MTYTFKAYLAGPFFNNNQIEMVERIKRILTGQDIGYYSPKDECLYTPENEVTSREVFDSNISAILACDFMVAITDNRDVGTMFEAGFAFANRIPIVYIWINHQDKPFNIMLAESGIYVAYGYAKLTSALEHFRKTLTWPKVELRGEME